MKRTTVVLIGLMGLFTARQSWADQAGTSTAQFLQIGQGARAEGMGGAFTAVADDAYTTYWNPAGLAQITRQEVALNYLQYIQQINSQFASYVLPVNKLNGSIGVSGSYANFGKIDPRDASNQPAGGDASVNSYAGSLAWGQALGDRLAIGFGGKVFKENLAGNAASGVAGDAGLLFFILPNRLSFGFSAMNVGPKIQVGTTKESLPRTLRAGLAVRAIPGKLVFDVDGEKPTDASLILHAGGEFTYQNRFILRAGYQDTKEAKGGLSAGAGFIWRPQHDGSSDFFGHQDKAPNGADGLEIRIDYGFVDYGDFSSTHRFGIHVMF